MPEVDRIMAGGAAALPTPFARGSLSGLGEDEVREHYQRRLATCFGVLGSFLLATELLVHAILLTLARDHWRQQLTDPYRLVDLARVLLILLGWWVCRGRLLSERALAVVEVGVTTLAMVLFTDHLAFDLTDQRADLSAVAMLLLLLSLRAGLLPAPPRWALLVSAAAAAPLMAASVLRFHAESTPEKAWTFLATTLFWCVMTTMMSVFVARTIHGLREQVVTARRLGQYTLEDKIGEGGMGVVYRARHAMLRRPAAIKVLQSARASETDLARFEREAQLTSQLTHPNTVSIFDYGRTAARGFYYVMEYLDGFDLERLVKEHGPLDPPRVIRILVQVSGALSEAHLLGLVHRDIKPANIILTRRADEPDVAKVVDFGLVRAQQEMSDENVTGINAIIGTPSYLAPEAIVSAGSADARSDLYALGAVGYFLLTGQQVFRGASLIDLCHKHLTEPPVPPSRRSVQPIAADLEAVILQCLAKEPEERPCSADALRAALLACSDAARYDQDAGRRWWREHRSHPRPAPAPAGPVTTLPIDLAAARALPVEPALPDEPALSDRP